MLAAQTWRPSLGPNSSAILAKKKKFDDDAKVNLKAVYYKEIEEMLLAMDANCETFSLACMCSTVMAGSKVNPPSRLHQQNVDSIYTPKNIEQYMSRNLNECMYENSMKK
jgi:hypothetical protein